MMYQYHPPVGRALSTSRDAGLDKGAAGFSERTAVETPRLSLRPVVDGARFSLRIEPKGLEAASKVLGLALPKAIGGAASSGGRIAICLGPDEWYLIAPPSEQESLERGFAELYATTIHSLVDVGHREVGIEIAGAGAAHALQAAIAFDIEAMPFSSGCRTLMDKAQIILLREAEDRFRIEVWRSFADHVWELLQIVGREIELGI
ncbi:sarcosine oxidase [Boseaceae bacterium BT-24-1]|nr:sarcosine oxidase [Boseaceae bacterium BT-24-1]